MSGSGGFGSGFGQQPGQQPFGSSSVFGSSSSSTGSSIFGSSGLGTGTGTGFGTSTGTGTGFGTGPGAGTVFGASTGFGTNTGTSGFGTGTGSVFGANTGFGTGTSGFGTSTRTSGFATSAGSSGFGTSTGTSGFGASTGTSGFGTSTGTSGFGTSTGTSGFSTSTGTSGFGTGTGTSGFGTSTGTSGFGTSTGTSVFGSGTSGFGSGSTSSGFGSTGAGATGFGSISSGTSVFGSAGTGTSGFSTGSSGSSTGFGTPSTGGSVFGSGSGAGVSLFKSSNTGSSVFGSAGSGTSVFGSGTSTAAPAFGTGAPVSTTAGFGAGTSVFGASSTATGFGSSTSSSASGFGSSTPLFGSSTTSSSIFGSTGSSALAFGTTTSSATSFGTAFSQGQGTGGSVFGATTGSSGFASGGASQPVFGTGGVSQTGFGGAGSSQSGFGTGSSVFGTSVASSSSTTGQWMTGQGASSVFGSGVKGFGAGTSQASSSGFPSTTTSSGGSGATQASSSGVFGVFGRSTTAPQSASFPTGTSTVSTFGAFGTGKGADSSMSDTGNKGMLFPAAATASGQSVFGKSSSSQSPSSSAGSSALFGSPAKSEKTTQPSTQASSSSVFGGKHASSSESTFKWTQPGTTASTLVKTEPGISGSGKDKPDAGAGSESGGVKSEGLFGKKAAAGSSVFGRLGNKESGSTFSFPVSTSGASNSGESTSGFGSSNQKRGADNDADKEGASDSKKGRGEGQGDRRAQVTPERQKIHRLSSTMDVVSNKTVIHCKRVPASLNKNSILRRHFSKFGTVKSVRTVPAKMAATIQFETPEDAMNAKKNGSQLSRRDPPMIIFFKSSTSSRSPSTEEAEQESSSGKRPSSSSSSQAKGGGFLRRNVSQRTLALPSIVADELAGMGGSDDQIADLGRGYRVLERPGTREKSVADELAGMGGSDNQIADLGRGYRVLERPGIREKSSYENSSARRASPSRRVSPSRQMSPPPASSSSSSSPSRPARVDAASFASLRRTVCTTTTEKIAVLDARDKLLRQMQEKQHGSVMQRKAFAGTCPDMCPEKERLYREDVRRLSIYEIIPGSSIQTGSTSLVDHSKAVKEYSRSSADQDEPLPHELRPLPVLEMTMNYLLSNVADLGEDGKWAEWYDFLWNRTRGIRKDITQQQLCSLEVVGLIEKCTRFHIYCSERLCAEDMMVFDSKINNENLTKCLQTLKELYADLENKHNIRCPNEAEFRAYMVLMNLNEGDTLREVQQLRPDVRDSHEIEFAVKAYSALNANNFVRFFRLVQSASFLNACILHRYFNQVRARALEVLLRAYTKGSNQKTPFPMSKLVRMLAFEDEAEVQEFCANYGLVAEGSDLVLDRSMFIEPETAIPFWRARRLVESKQMVSVGEVINGEQLQPVKLPPPQCSFDEQGRFIGSLEGLLDASVSSEVKVKTEQPAPQAASVPPDSQPPPYAAATHAPADSRQVVEQTARSVQQQQALFTNEAVKMVARDLFWEVIDEAARDISQSLYNAIQHYLSSDSTIAEEIIADVSSKMTREVSKDVLDSERALKLQQKEAERRDRMNRLTEEANTVIVNSVVQEEVAKIAQAEVREARARAHAERKERCASNLCSELLEEVTCNMMRQVSEEVYAVDVVARLQLLSELQKAVELQRTSHWFALWRKRYTVRQRQKRAMLDFPCAPSMQRPSNTLRSLCPERPETHALIPEKAAILINRRAQLSLMSPLEAERRSLTLTAHLSLVSLLNSLQRTRAWQPLSLASILSAPLISCVKQWPEQIRKELDPVGIQWKMLLSLPDESKAADKDEDDSDSEGDLTRVLSSWLCAKFTHGESSTQLKAEREVLSLYSVQLSADQDMSQSTVKCSVCVRGVPEFTKLKPKQDPSAQHQTITKGTSAIMFLLPHADTQDETPWQAAGVRLHKILEAKLPVPPVPLVLLLPCSANSTEPSTSLTNSATAKLNVNQLLDKELVSEVAVVELPIRSQQPLDTAIVAPILQTQLTEAVKWLAGRMPEPPVLRSSYLRELVEDVLTEHFFTPVLQDQRSRRQAGKLHQCPNTLIDLYNNVLDHIGLALTSPALQNISWPAPEFVEASEAAGVPHPNWNSKSHLADVYQLVSSLRLPWFHYQDQEACEWSHVCQDVWSFVRSIAKSAKTSPVSLTSRISFLLAKACSEFENLCSLTQNEDYCTPTYVNAPWVDIIIECVNFQLQRLHSWKEEGVEVVCGDTEVFYEEEDLEEFEPPSSWTKALSDTEDKESGLVAETVQQAVALHSLTSAGTPSNIYSDSDWDMDAEQNRNQNNMNVEVEQVDILASRTQPDQTDTPPAAASRTQLAEPMPDEVRTAFGLSQNLLIHVEEEKRKAQEFEIYLEKALRGDSLDTDFTGMSPVVSQFGSVPQHSFATPAFTPTFPLGHVTRGTPPSGRGGVISDRRAKPLQIHNQNYNTPTLSQRRSSSVDRFGTPSRELFKPEGEEDREEPWFRPQNTNMSENFELFKEDLQSQRRASDLFEKRLQAVLES